jgi:hypothetical protein
MVWRAMVRDDAYFYDPLGLASRAIRVNFQSGANAYLYGTRFFTYLAYAHSPEKVMPGSARRDEPAQLCRPVPAGVRTSARAGVAAVDRLRARFQRRNLAEVRKFPITPQTKMASTAIGSMSAHVLRRSTGTLYARIALPAWSIRSVR